MKYLKIYELFQNSMTLNELYNYELPNKNELIWGFVSIYDFDKDFGLCDINVSKWYNLIKDSIKYITPEQSNIIDEYKDIDKPVVIHSDENILIDGYHRIVSAYKNGIKDIKALDLFDEL